MLSTIISLLTPRSSASRSFAILVMEASALLSNARFVFPHRSVCCVLSHRINSPRRALLSLLLPSTLNLPRHSLVAPFATKGLGPSEPFSYHTGAWVFHPTSVLFTSRSAPTVFTPPDPSLGDVPSSGSFKPIDPATAMRLYKTQGER